MRWQRTHKRRAEWPRRQDLSATNGLLKTFEKACKEYSMRSHVPRQTCCCFFWSVCYGFVISANMRKLIESAEGVLFESTRLAYLVFAAHVAVFSITSNALQCEQRSVGQGNVLLSVASRFYVVICFSHRETGICSTAPRHL